MKPKILIALGSPSDKKLLEQVSLDDACEYYLSIASAHRTPETVTKHAVVHKWDAIIAAAGLTNALVNEYVKQALSETLVVGVPVDDAATNGLSSLLSSQELPPGYVVGTVGVNQLGKAVELAKKLLVHKYDRICLWYAGDVEKQCPKKAGDVLAQVGVQHHFVHKKKFVPEEGELVLAMIDWDCHELESELRDASIVIACPTDLYGTVWREGQRHHRLYTYVSSMKSIPNAFFVGFDNQINLALFGAKVVSRSVPKVGEDIRAYVAQGTKKYAPYSEVQQLTPAVINALGGK